MREIKYRVWDKKLNKWANVWRVLKFNGRRMIWDKERYEVSEFSSLKDKNGTEIYEGDIVRTTELHMNSEVIWTTRGFINGFYLPFLLIGLSDGTVKDLDLHVIGNIYENPELL